ncbi:collagen alpha-4(VI) chain-like [Gigantopelta aegis]|uniref:collagen alpha-4(VI) chain-like n=1 Tax=Gigantopelta aegis TaxID=1735272 RepID=UPI001B887454|nr:collagen alpha-4(VI) chain-like [Gigantopelta aegis]
MACNHLILFVGCLLHLALSQTTVCENRKADVVFLLDSSGSEGKPNFNKQLEFVKNIVKKFNIGPDAVQIGAATFSTTVKNAFWLNQYKTKSQILAAISNMSYDAGNTETNLALAFARTQSFTPAHGARKDATQILVIMTDGQSSEKPKTIVEAHNLHATKVRVISIGVGKNIDSNELNTIATDKNHAFTVANFTALQTIEHEVVKTTCHTGELVCENRKADVVFLLDSSGSEGKPNFNKQLEFVKNIVKKFNIGPDAVQIGAATFSTTVKNAFWLNQYKTKSQILAVISNMSYDAGNTETNLALAFARTQSFTPAHGARKDATQILVIMTDGQSSEKAKTIAEAHNMHATKVRVISIGVGKNIDANELNTIATDKNHAFTVANFTALQTIENEVVKTTCHSGELECRSVPADIVFLLDASGSEGTSNFQKQIDFVHNFAKQFSIGPNAVQIGAVTFSNGPHNSFYLNDHKTKPDLLQAIKHIHYTGGGTQTHLGLKFVRENSFSPAHGARGHVSQFLIVLTDGNSANSGETAKEATLLHNTGVRVISIGIGSGIRSSELKNIASDNKHVFAVGNFDALKTIEKEIHAITCTACRNKPADIVFLLDTSGSEGQANFQTQLKFVENFTKDFKVGPNEVQFSVVTFSSTVKNEFWLNQHQDRASLIKVRAVPKLITRKEDMFYLTTHSIIGLKLRYFSIFTLVFSLTQAMQQIKFRSGNTQTDDGLNFVRLNSFLPSHGGRNNSQQIVIVLTDGQSTEKPQTAHEATKMHSTGVKVISIGIGNSVDKTELLTIASEDKFMFTVPSFATLHTIENRIKQTACGPSSGCKSDPVDLVFLLDSSSSEGRRNFKTQLQFVRNFTRDFDIGPSAVQVGVVTFSTHVQNRVWLNSFRSKRALMDAIVRIPYHSGVTHTGEGLRFVRQVALSAAHGARPNAKKVVIVLTDGQSSPRAETRIEAALLHKTGARVITIGIGHGVNVPELKNIATGQQSVFQVSGFDALHTVESEIRTKTCQSVTTPCASSTADIVFLLDSSGSEGPANFQKQLGFVGNFIKAFNIGPKDVQFSVVTFASTPKNEFYLNSFSSKPALLAALHNIKYISGGTNTDGALKFVRQNSFTAAHGSRPGAARILVVLTDGQSNSKTQTISESQLLHQAGIEVMSIGIGNGVDKVELGGIASDAKHTFTVANFNALKTIQLELQKVACNVQPTGAPVTTTHAPICGVTEKGDIVFILDSSGSEGPSNFQKQKVFVEKFVHDFTIGPKNVMVGLIRFSSSADNQFWLNQHTTKQQLVYAVQQVPYASGSTATDLALQMARTQSFTAAHGARPGVKKYAIVVTDGASRNHAQTIAEATKLKHAGINVIAIGVGSGINRAELQGMATDSHHVFTVTNFDSLQTIHKEVQKKTCAPASG